MDTVTLAYYAIVCAGLNFVGPRLGGPIARLATGALVGIAAAALLPLIKQL